MIALAVITLVVANCVAVIAGLAWSAKLPGNNWIGIRAPEARKSRENWDITHRVAGPPWAVAAIAFFGAALVSFLAVQPGASGWLWLWYAVAVLAGIAMLGVGGAIGSHTIALYDARKSNSDSAEGCGCGEGGCGAEASAAVSSDPAGDCGVSGGCGSCGLNGLCGSDPQAGAAVDREALKRAARRQD